VEGSVSGVVRNLLHDPGRGTPVAHVSFSDGERCLLTATEGLYAGKCIWKGGASLPEIGNVLPVGKIPEGTLVSNIEIHRGDGGKIAKSSGTYATVVAHTPAGTELKLPSGKSLYLKDLCRATIGVVAGAGRVEKPFLKAGNKFLLMMSRGRHWPTVKGQAMVAASHPFGGGRHKHAGKPTTVSRHAPPGQKVGLIAARKSGRAKRAG